MTSEASETCYRTLCSLETLRSGSKGFFRDFSEKVIRVVGEQWIGKVFGRLTSDEDRIRVLFTDVKLRDTVLETLNRTEILYRGKDATVSRAKRLEGFEAAAAARHRDALLLFGQAVLRAPPLGKCDAVDRGFGLPLALLARAETFLALNQHQLALQDLSFVEEMDRHLPNELRAMLARIKKPCEAFVRASNEEKSLLPVKRLVEEEAEVAAVTRLSGGANPRLPSASLLLDIEETESAGKRVIAAKPIEPGDRLVVEEPFAATLLPEFFGTHCQHCFSRFVAPVGCPDCSSVAFCGRSCRDVALASYHKYECKILALLIGSGMSVLSMLALRMTTQAGPAGCINIHRALNRSSSSVASSNEQQQQQQQQQPQPQPKPKLSKSAKRRLRRKKLGDSRCRNEAAETEKKSESDPLRVYRLVTHEKQRTAKDFFERSLMAAFLLKCLQRVGFFEGQTATSTTSKDEEEGRETLDDREIAVAALLLRQLQLLQFNAHEVFETRLGREQHRFRGSRPLYVGVAVYPTVARFNHDCYPAVTRYFVGRSIVIRATRSLRPGDVVAENYGPIFTKKSLHERQRTLAGRYWFRCECTACREDWPRFETLTNDNVTLRCPTEGCSKLHRRPTQDSDDDDSCGSVVCSSCRRRVHLRERLERVGECERLYAEGIEAMTERQQPETALNLLFEAAAKFHRIASPPHKHTHLAEIAASACMALEGNVYRPEIFL